MNIDEAIARIESCRDRHTLLQAMHEMIGDYGFSAFNFLDVGQPGVDEPFYAGTHSHAWDTEYKGNGFIHVDPVLPLVRRRNTPFRWSDLTLPETNGRRKPGAIKLMEAATDHGFRDGLVVPFHFIDHLGYTNSALCVFFWLEQQSKLTAMLSHKKHEIHLLTIYFAQRMSDIAAQEMKSRAKFFDEDGRPLRQVNLTDRERDVLAWAARGKTADETGDILSLSTATVNEYLDNARRKLGATNKAHAASIALFLGLIDL